MPSRQAVSTLPPPWHADHLARVSIAGLRAEFGPKLTAVLAESGPAHNKVAIERSFGRIVAACAPATKPMRMRGERHQSLAAGALVPARSAAARNASDEASGISACRLLVIAGKRLDWRSVVPLLDVAPHAMARAVERGGFAEATSIHDLIRQAAKSAETILLAFAQHGADRLGAGSVPVLVPAGFGAFLGHLRILRPADAVARVLPVVEAHTWIHRGMFSVPQAEAEESVLAAEADESALEESVAVMCRLPGPRSGDRRLRDGVSLVAAGDGSQTALRADLTCVPPVAMARLARGMADPDQIAWERRVLRF